MFYNIVCAEVFASTLFDNMLIKTIRTHLGIIIQHDMQVFSLIPLHCNYLWHDSSVGDCFVLWSCLGAVLEQDLQFHCQCFTEQSQQFLPSYTLLVTQHFSSLMQKGHSETFQSTPPFSQALILLNPTGPSSAKAACKAYLSQPQVSS